MTPSGAADRIWWERNPRLDPVAFDRLYDDVRGYLDARELYVQDLFGGADPAYRLAVRFVTPNAWHHLAASFQNGTRRIGIALVLTNIFDQA